MRQKIIDAILMLILFALFLCCYVAIGKRFIAVTHNFERAVLGFDGYAVTRVMTRKAFVAKYHRTTAHPLFLLFFKPIGMPLAESLGHAHSAMFLSAIAGSLGLTLFYALLRKIKLHPLHAFLFTVLLGISTPHLIFSSVPETYSFAATSLILLALIYLSFDRIKPFVMAHLMASVFALGITVTNIVWSIILLIGKLRQRFPVSKQVILVLVFITVTALISGALFLLQDKLYRHTRDFFTSQLYHSNIKYVTFEVFEHPVEVLGRKIPHFFVYNVVTPEIVRNRLTLGSGAVIKTRTSLTLTVYFLLLALSSYLIIRFKLFRMEFFGVLVVYYLFNICFYLFYGTEHHLYHSHYTFCLIAAISLPLSLGTELPRKFSYLLTAIVALLIPLLALNNLLFLLDIWENI